MVLSLACSHLTIFITTFMKVGTTRFGNSILPSIAATIKDLRSRTYSFDGCLLFMESQPLDGSFSKLPMIASMCFSRPTISADFHNIRMIP